MEFVDAIGNRVNQILNSGEVTHVCPRFIQLSTDGTLLPVHKHAVSFLLK
jgi:hypothetical protein